MNHRDIAATLGFVSTTPRCPNFRLRLNVKRLCVIKLRIASSGRNRAEHYWHSAHAEISTNHDLEGRATSVFRRAVRSEIRKHPRDFPQDVVSVGP